LIVCKHFPLVACQCDTHPSALTLIKTFLAVLESLCGLHLTHVVGYCDVFMHPKLNIILPELQLYTFIVPSLQVAAIKFPSGSNLTHITSMGFSGSPRLKCFVTFYRAIG